MRCGRVGIGHGDGTMPLVRTIISLLLGAAVALAGASAAPAARVDPSRLPPSVEGENGATIEGGLFEYEWDDQPRHAKVAFGLWIDAWMETVEAHPRCDRVVPEPPSWSEEAPSAGMLAALPVLQRPVTPADRLPPEVRTQLAGAYAEWTRAVRLADGRETFLVPAPDVPHNYLPTPCRRLTHARLLRELEGRRPAVRRAARRTERSYNRVLYRPESVRRVESVKAIGRDGVGTPAVDLQTLRHRGSYGVIPHRSGDGHLVVGLVPDGVTAVRMRFVSFRAGIPGAAPPLTVTRTPVDGVVAFELDRGPVDARLRRVVWQRADGSRTAVCEPFCI